MKDSLDKPVEPLYIDMQATGCLRWPIICCWDDLWTLLLGDFRVTHVSSDQKVWFRVKRNCTAYATHLYHVTYEFPLIPGHFHGLILAAFEYCSSSGFQNCNETEEMFSPTNSRICFWTPGMKQEAVVHSNRYCWKSSLIPQNMSLEVKKNPRIHTAITPKSI